jgi:hypothetical protein
MAYTIQQHRPKKRQPPTHLVAIVAELKAHAIEIRKQGVTSLALFGS